MELWGGGFGYAEVLADGGECDGHGEGVCEVGWFAGVEHGVELGGNEAFDLWSACGTAAGVNSRLADRQRHRHRAGELNTYFKAFDELAALAVYGSAA
ncbi:hypothetical protein ABZ914_40500 [Spirillospora sp. NPDC046719]